MLFFLILHKQLLLFFPLQFEGTWFTVKNSLRMLHFVLRASFATSCHTYRLELILSSRFRKFSRPGVIRGDYYKT